MPSGKKRKRHKVDKRKKKELTVTKKKVVLTIFSLNVNVH
jgi:hypothetical protein